jgi:hypothetical protein
VKCVNVSSYRFVYKEILVSEDYSSDPLSRCTRKSLNDILDSKMVVVIGNKCYTGFSNLYNGSVSQIGSGPWNLYIKSCETYNCCIFRVFIKYFTAFSATELGIFAQLTIPVVNEDNFNWTKYIYRIYSGPNSNETLCKALCAFDNQNPDGNPCQFTAVSTLGTCYLGTFGKESTVLSTTPTVSEISLKTGL